MVTQIHTRDVPRDPLPEYAYQLVSLSRLGLRALYLINLLLCLGSCILLCAVQARNVSFNQFGRLGDLDTASFRPLVEFWTLLELVESGASSAADAAAHCPRL